MQQDTVSIIEAAYRVEVSSREWLAGVLDAARHTLDQGAGVSAVVYDASNPARMRVLEVASHGVPPLLTDESTVRIIETADADYVRATWRSLPVALGSETPGVDQQPGWAQLASMGVVDTLCVNAIDPSGIGCWMSATSPRAVRLTARMRTRWGRVAAHIASGLRLRRRLDKACGSHPDVTTDADAVLDVGGMVQHAEGEAAERAAREALRDAAVALDHARGPERRRDPDGAVAEWRGLIQARWSLIDHFDSDGRRYLVARRNAAEVPGLA